MFGANTDELRRIAGVFGNTGDDARTAGTVTNTEVQGVEWLGPDADEFRSDYESYVVTELKALAIVLELKERELERQADEQDVCSEGTGPGRSPGDDGGPGGPNGPWANGMPWWVRAYKLWNVVRKPFQFARFLMEAGTALLNPGILRAHGLFSWAGLTGKGLGQGAQFIEGLLKGNPLYTALRHTTDFLSGNHLSKFLEGKLPQGWADDVAGFFGKEGRALGRGLGVLGIGIDGFEMGSAISQGNIWGENGAVWNGAQMALGAAAFIPGPVGWVAAGLSAGMTIYENREAIGNFISGAADYVSGVANSVGQAATGVANAVADGISDVASALNPFD